MHVQEKMGMETGTGTGKWRRTSATHARTPTGRRPSQGRRGRAPPSESERRAPNLRPSRTNLEEGERVPSSMVSRRITLSRPLVDCNRGSRVRAAGGPHPLLGHSMADLSTTTARGRADLGAPWPPAHLLGSGGGGGPLLAVGEAMAGGGGGGRRGR